MFRKSFSVLLVIAGSVALLPSFALADSPFSITVDPPSIKSSALPGNSTSKYITVENTSDSPMSVKIYAQDWEYLPDGSKSFQNLGTSKFSLNANIQLFANQIVLKPKSSQTVIVKITSPKTSKGGRYSVVFFEGSPSKAASSATRSNVKLVGRIGTIIYHEISGTATHNLTAKLPAEISSAASKDITVSVLNNGNVAEYEPINLLIVSETKKVVDRIAFPEVKLLPGDHRDVSVKPSLALKPGKYSAIVSFQTEAGPQYSTSALVVK